MVFKDKFTKFELFIEKIEPFVINNNIKGIQAQAFFKQMKIWQL
jgi:hypothetical protein